MVVLPASAEPSAGRPEEDCRVGARAPEARRPDATFGSLADACVVVRGRTEQHRAATLAGVSRWTLILCRERYARDGLGRLGDQPRSGRPVTEAPAGGGRLRAAATRTPGHRSRRSCGLDQRTVHVQTTNGWSAVVGKRPAMAGTPASELGRHGSVLLDAPCGESGVHAVVVSGEVLAALVAGVVAIICAGFSFYGQAKAGRAQAELRPRASNVRWIGIWKSSATIWIETPRHFDAISTSSSGSSCWWTGTKSLWRGRPSTCNPASGTS